MRTDSEIRQWSLAHAPLLQHAHHALTQPLDIDFDLDLPPDLHEQEPRAAARQILLRIRKATVADAFAYGAYSGQIGLGQLFLPPLLQLDQSFVLEGQPSNVGQEVLPRLEASAAFRELDALRTDDRLALQAISRLKTTQIPYRDELVTRLEELLGAYQGDYGDRSLSATAIDAFVAFLNSNRYLRKPSITATPTGDLYAEWTGSDNTLLGIRFFPTGEVQYVLFTPNPLHDSRTDRSSGSTTADALMGKISHLGASGWLTE